MAIEITQLEMEQLNAYSAASIAAVAKGSGAADSLAVRLRRAFDELVEYASGGSSDERFRWSSDFLVRTLLVPAAPVPSLNYTPPAFFVATPLGRLIAKCHARLFAAQVAAGELLNQEQAARYVGDDAQKVSRWADNGRINRVVVYERADRSKAYPRPMYFRSEIDQLKTQSAGDQTTVVPPATPSRKSLSPGSNRPAIDAPSMALASVSRSSSKA